MHYHHFTLEQRDNLERTILAGSEPPSRKQHLLWRLQAADYGVCRRCGADIPYLRLLESPGAAFCAGCETRA